MEHCDLARAAAGPPRGLLRSQAPAGETEHRRVLPDDSLAAHVAHFWWVRWVLTEPFNAETLPHPSVHVVFEDGSTPRGAEIAGVSTRRFSRRLAGEGCVFGIKFRPAAFQSLWRAPMTDLTNRVLPVAAVLGADGDALARALLRAPELEAKIDLAEALLRARLSPLPPEVTRMRDLVERMATDRSLRRAEDAAAAVGLGLRALERRFRRSVGVTPKWVIQRYRLHEAAAQLEDPQPPPLATLAADLGYADQSHFARDFKAMVGRTPRQYAAEGAARDNGDW